MSFKCGHPETAENSRLDGRYTRCRTCDAERQRRASKLAGYAKRNQERREERAALKIPVPLKAWLEPLPRVPEVQGRSYQLAPQRANV